MTQQHEDNSWLYAGLAIIIGGAIFYFLFFHNSGYVKIKYRDDKVNISANNFEPLNESDSTVKGAWYDSSEDYMVIKLGSTYYHYCGMPSGVWYGLKSSTHLYSYYQEEIKGNFDCRVFSVPEYQ